METRDLGPVIYETDGPIAWLILNWPEKANAQSSEMVHAFDDALTLADRDYDVRVLIIKANGGVSAPAMPSAASTVSGVHREP